MSTKKHSDILLWEDTNTNEKLINSINKNNISIVTTDTVLGFLGALTMDCFDKLNTIKGRSSEKKYLILVYSMAQALKFITKDTLSDDLIKLLEQCWPGEVTVIGRSCTQIAPFISSSSQTVAIRCPQHKGLLKLLQSFNGLFSTSANKSGNNIPASIEELDEEIVAQVEYIVTEKNKKTTIQPSTIIDVSNEKDSGMISVVRKGVVSVETLQRWYSGKIIT